ncbi:hypothetical protein DFH09DRAFT_1303688 [Mycena vulgaris]|nr:hypothetical protein DFH09DRAFT_1303688 [Mycena vulgaris]
MSSTRLYLKSTCSISFSTLTLLPSYHLPSAKRDDVYTYLERFGRLTELKIIESESFTYGFAQFSSEEDAKYVLDTFRHGRLFLGHRTIIEPARPLRKDMPSTETHSSSVRTAHSPRYGVQPKYYPNRGHQCRYPVLVDNIPRHICWQELKDFGRLGGLQVAYCDLEREKNGRGFIEYLSREDAEEAIRTLHGQKLGAGRALRPVEHHTIFTTLFSKLKMHLAVVVVSFPDRYTSPLYSDESVQPVALHPDLHTFSKAVDSFRSALFGEATAPGSGLALQTPSYIHSSEPITQPAAESNDYYNFDQYLRLSYDRNRLEYLPGCFS